ATGETYPKSDLFNKADCWLAKAGAAAIMPSAINGNSFFTEGTSLSVDIFKGITADQIFS
ncbi:hypothetical protein, partial [Klebsiella pneumoniae]|uniref:hypothetical protein n=1 Tax=Klebsiella pneumoniae TaxID=573 RepID=UPI000668B61A